jgi:hypothetical protein
LKITLDIGKLLETNAITQEEHDRLLGFARKESSRHVWGVLSLMGAIAIALGAVGLFPELAAVVLDSLFAGLWSLFGALGRQGSHLVVFLALMSAGTALRSGFLVGISCFVIASFLGGTWGYSHASYWVAVEEPASTTLVFSLLAYVGLLVSQRVGTDDERLAIIFSRTCLIFVNVGFWVGSLWGSRSPLGQIPDYVFAILWAGGLLGTAIWAGRVGRLWVVNAAITFGAIHFYTQFFARLGANPLSLLLGGVLLVAITVSARRYQRHLKNQFSVSV